MRKRKLEQDENKTSKAPLLTSPNHTQPVDYAAHLNQAVQSNCVEQVLHLLSLGIDSDIKIQGVPILRTACLAGNIPIVLALLRHGCKINAAGETDGGTALMTAALMGHVTLCELLLKSGADANQAASNGGTALFCACVRGYPEVTEMLLRWGANPNATGITEGSTALHMAALSGGYRNCELLLMAGADVNQRRFDQTSALCFAAAGGFSNICELLLRYNAETMIASKDNLSPLCYAADGGHLQTCMLLLDNGASVHGVGYDANTSPLHCAVSSNRPDIARLLLQRGADPVRVAHGTTALDIAHRTMNQQLIQLITAHLEGCSLR